MTETIILNIISEMSNAQKNFINGNDKKAYVMTKIKEYMNKDDYDKYEPMISLIIDFLKYLATNKKILDTIKNKKCFSCISN